MFHTESYWIHSRAYGPMLDGCDAILAMTDHEKRFVESRATRRHVHIVGAGVDPERFVHAAGADLRARHDLGDALVVGYVGRMTSPKGVGRLIRAMQIVWQADPGIRLLLAGAGLETAAARQDEVAQALAALTPAERSRVTIIGKFSESEKATIFDALDVFAMPSMAESFGIAYLEAWMRKKAVIGCRIPSSECVIDDGVDGLLVRPEESNELAAAILRLGRDRRERDRMGEAGHAKTVGHFTWEHVTDRIEQVYRDVSSVATHKAPSGLTFRASPVVAGGAEPPASVNAGGAR
jgi:glycosyltransferase involved in cell wall biosynthesis